VCRSTKCYDAYGHSWQQRGFSVSPRKATTEKRNRKPPEENTKTDNAKTLYDPKTKRAKFIPPNYDNSQVVKEKTPLGGGAVPEQVGDMPFGHVPAVEDEPLESQKEKPEAQEFESNSGGQRRNYQLKAPIEDPTAAKRVVNKILDQVVEK